MKRFVVWQAGALDPRIVYAHRWTVLHSGQGDGRYVVFRDRWNHDVGVAMGDVLVFEAVEEDDS